jgi:hypothetical protein
VSTETHCTFCGLLYPSEHEGDGNCDMTRTASSAPAREEGPPDFEKRRADALYAANEALLARVEAVERERDEWREKAEDRQRELNDLEQHALTIRMLFEQRDNLRSERDAIAAERDEWRQAAETEASLRRASAALPEEIREIFRDAPRPALVEGDNKLPANSAFSKALNRYERAALREGDLGSERRRAETDAAREAVRAAFDAAVRTASSEAYERAARAVEETPVSWTDQAETAEAAAARIRALATQG